MWSNTIIEMLVILTLLKHLKKKKSVSANVPSLASASVSVCYQRAGNRALEPTFLKGFHSKT